VSQGIRCWGTPARRKVRTLLKIVPENNFAEEQRDNINNFADEQRKNINNFAEEQRNNINNFAEEQRNNINNFTEEQDKVTCSRTGVSSSTCYDGSGTTSLSVKYTS